MNFLAHVFLADHDTDAIVGQLCGDFVRGVVDGRFPATIEHGIRMHRAVDAFTDQHPVNRRARQLFISPHRRFAGIICDVAYDHFLALEWQHYCDTPLVEYAALVDDALWQKRHVLPAGLREFMPYLKSEKILTSNVFRTHIDLTLQRISRRRSSMAPLASAPAPLWQNRDALKQCFDEFFSDLIAHTSKIRTGFTTAGRDPSSD